MASDVIDAGDGLALTVPTLLREGVLERRTAPLLVCDDDVLTYADADLQSRSLAKGLVAAGVGMGSHVGILHPNGPAFVVSWLAASRIRAGAPPIPHKPT